MLVLFSWRGAEKGRREEASQLLCSPECDQLHTLSLANSLGGKRKGRRKVGLLTPKSYA